MSEGILISNLEIPVAKGDKGDTGDAGKISSLQVTMLASTATPTVTNTGTAYDAKYILGIPRGIGVSTAAINDDGELVITLTDSTVLNVGTVVGTTISSVYIDDEENIVMELSDGTTIGVGNIETELTNILSDYYDKDTADSMFALIDETGNKIDLSLNASTYVMTLTLKDKNNNTLSTGTVDLPLESVVVSGSYDSVNKKIVLTLQSGSTIEFSVADLVSGLVSTSDLETYVQNTDYATTSTGGVIKTGNKIKLTNGVIEAEVVDTLTYKGLNDNWIASCGTLENYIDRYAELKGNKVTSISSASTDTQYPSAKCVYDLIGDLETILNTLDVGGGV